MNKVLKKVGLSAVVATFVFGMATTSSALLPQDPDNETSIINVSADVFVEATDTASYSDTEKYDLTLDNTTEGGLEDAGRNQGKSGLTYLKNFSSTNGLTHVVSKFDATEEANDSTPNIDASNKIVFNTNYEGLNAGTFTGLEKIAYKRCQCADNNGLGSFCGRVQNNIPKAQADITMGGSMDVQYAAVNTAANIKGAVAYSTTNKDGHTNYNYLPSVEYSINARGLGIYGANDDAIGSVKAGMKANIHEQNANNGADSDTTTVAYEQHTAAKGYVKFSKAMKYQSSVRNAASATSNFNSVP